MDNTPIWFNDNEYFEFLHESQSLFEANIPLQKEKFENRKKMWAFDANMARRRANLKMEIMRDNARAKARGIQMGLGESFKHKLMASFLNSLTEERTPIKAEKRKMRPEVDPADRERDRKRESRRQDKQSNGLDLIVIVKNNKRGKIEIIPKDDFDPDYHTLLKGKVKKQDKGNITERDLKYYSRMDEFINTKTSIRLIGRVEGKEEVSETEDSEQKINPPRLRVPKDGKEITDPTSTYPDWDHTTDQFAAAIPMAFGSLGGKEASPEYQQMMDNSRTLGETIQRFLQEILSSFPALGEMKFSPVDPVVKTGKLWSSYGMKEAAPTATLIGKSPQQEIGFSVKIGEQIRPVARGEAGLVLNTVLSSVDPNQLASTFSLFVTDFLGDLRTSFSSIPNPPPIDVRREGSILLAKQKWIDDTAKSQQSRLVNKAADMFEDFINNNSQIKSALLLECLTGNSKFEGKKGSAQMMLAARKDGSDARAITLNQQFADNLAKSEDTEMSFKFTQAPNASGGFLQGLFQKLIPTITESAQDVVGDLEKIKDQLSNPLQFLQTFEIQLADIVYQNPILYSEFAQDENSEKTNIITFNPGSSKEEEISIPVKSNYDTDGIRQNYLEKGIEDVLNEYFFVNDYLREKVINQELTLDEAISVARDQFVLVEKRNYRKEYDNYHGKKEQRERRGDRVKSRRMAEDKGLVEKGDGKDVHHVNGDTSDNSEDNIKILPKSKNRSMNEEHGAGFEGTSVYLKNLINQTPLAAESAAEKEVPYWEDRYVKKTKKKK